jgi:hypothetical protein
VAERWTERWNYKGMALTVEYQDEDHAEATVEDRTIAMSRYGGWLWACDDAYFTPDDLRELVRHLVDYWYIITDPNTAPFEGPRPDELPERPGGAVPAHRQVGQVLRQSGDRTKGGQSRGGARSRRR